MTTYRSIDINCSRGLSNTLVGIGYVDRRMVVHLPLLRGNGPTNPHNIRKPVVFPARDACLRIACTQAQVDNARVGRGRYRVETILADFYGTGSTFPDKRAPSDEREVLRGQDVIVVVKLARSESDDETIEVSQTQLVSGSCCKDNFRHERNVSAKDVLRKMFMLYVPGLKKKVG